MFVENYPYLRKIVYNPQNLIALIHLEAGNVIYLHKLLPLIVSPLGLLVVLMLLGVFLKRMWPTYSALVLTIVFSLPLTAHIIWRDLESPYPYKHADQIGKHDAVVVLSGMLGGFESDRGFVTEWGDPDRFFTGISLFKRGKAENVIFTRGQLPWSNSPPEGEVLRLKAVEMGVPESQILLTGVAANTAEEATQVKELMQIKGFKSVILVTSSFHMPRSKLLFDKAAVVSEAFPTDFKANSGLSWLSFIPSADAFKKTSSGFREYIGRLYYWLRFG